MGAIMSYGRVALVGAVLAGAWAGTALAAPAEFLSKAIKGDNSEMTLGAMAASQGTSPQVRAFGATLERDHRAARAKAAAVAARYHVDVPTGMAAAADVEFAKLHLLRGTAFDREFGRYMVEDHQDDIAEFEAEAKSGDPADVRALARQTLPDLRKHLAMASSIG